MLTSLGTLSITCAELKQLIRLLKMQDGTEQANVYTSSLMNAMCGEWQCPDNALHLLPKILLI